MRVFAIAVVWALFVGCDYTVPLVTKPEIKIDKAALGVWERVKEDGEKERLLVLPLGRTEYLVSFPSATADAMFARACLGKVGEERIVQLCWLGTVRGQLPTDRRVYQYASFMVLGETLTVRMLNAEVVPKNVASTKELLRAIAEGMDQPDLFREPMRFQKVKD